MDRSKTLKKSDTTRLAMIEAAIDIFGDVGFHAASNRQLAKAAGVNLALISYHFGGKSGLYLAVFRHINDQMAQRLKPLSEAIHSEIIKISGSQAKNPKSKQQPNTIDDTECHKPLSQLQRSKRSLELIEAVLFTHIEVLSSEQTAPWAKLILKEQQKPGEAFEIMYSGALADLLTILCKLIAIILQKQHDHSEVKLSALTLLGQTQILRSSRATLERYMGWESIADKEVALLKKQIHHNLQALFLTVSHQ